MVTYHRGELAAQERAGVRAEAERLSAMISPRIPRGAAMFLAEQPMLVVSAADHHGRLWATMLTGEPGFITVTDPSTLTVAAAPAAGDPLHEALDGPVGMIAIEPGTRRRVRMNGTAHPAADGLRIELAQVYGNCPKYIQKREWWLAESSPHTVDGGLTADDLRTVDTFFIATADAEGHADASHRGGNPGFLRALSPTHLRWPDYVGNSMFNTFGNLEVNPRAGLLIPDWHTGTLLHLTGTAAVDWDPAHAAGVPGAERLVDFTVEQTVRIENASALRWTRPELSRFNPPAA